MAWKSLSSPPLTIRSSSVKVSERSDSCAEIVALSPTVSIASDPSPLAVKTTDGTVVSTSMEISEAVALLLSSRSVKAPMATEITPSLVLSAAGVNNAVYRSSFT